MHVDFKLANDKMTEVKMNLKDETRRILHTHGIIPRKRLGQSFLVDKDALRRIVSYASLNERDTVLEIGAGTGSLTELLAEKAGKVVAIEVDPRLVQVLREKLKDRSNADLIEGDILELETRGFNKVVSAPPYSISSPILFWLFKAKYELAVMAFQEEFSRRLAAQVGSGDYGRLTVAMYYCSDVELLDIILKDCFFPPPKVDSRIIRLTPKKPPFKVDDEGFFFEVVRVVFTQKNKKVRNAILPLLYKYKIPKIEAVQLADTLPFHARRPRELAPEEIGLLANEVAKVLPRKS